MFCAHCGKPLPDGAAYCPGCGAAAPTLLAAPAPPPGRVEGSAGDPSAGPLPSAASGPAAVAEPAVRYAGFWRRVLAYIVDGIIIGAVMTPFGVGIGLAHVAAALNHEMTPEALGALVMASLFVWGLRMLVSWIYGAAFESSRWQATPGKMLLGMKVTDLQGRRLSFLQASGRALGKWLSGFLLGMGYVLVAFTDRKQGLHDLMAGTLVRR